MIGIIGGYGEVGIHACRLLQQCQSQSLKIGGRNPERGKRDFGHLFPEATWEQVDMHNEESLDRFAEACDLVLNCAGPSHRVSKRIARVCIKKGCHFVDAGFERGMEDLKLIKDGQAVLYAAGATPGLSGLLPFWFARQFDKVDNALTYTIALDKFTPTGAEDYLEGVLDETNAPMAAWRNGALMRGVLKREPGITLPFFEHEITAYPIFDDETLHIAKKLKLSDGRWYFATVGDKTPAALDTASINYQKSPQETIEKLCLASSLDMAGRTPCFNQLIQFDGEVDGVSIVKTAVMKSQGTTEMTGSVAAACAIAILDGKVDVKSPQPAATIDEGPFIVDFLLEQNVIKHLQILDHPIEELKEDEEGVL